MRRFAIAILVTVVAAFAISAAEKGGTVDIKRDLTKRDPAEFYDFNVNLLTNLGKRIKLDVKVATKDLNRKEGWLLSSYYITPDELRGIELRVPQSAISQNGKDTLRVRGEFRLSEVMDSRQGQISLDLLPAR